MARAGQYFGPTGRNEHLSYVPALIHSATSPSFVWRHEARASRPPASNCSHTMTCVPRRVQMRATAKATRRRLAPSAPCMPRRRRMASPTSSGARGGLLGRMVAWLVADVRRKSRRRLEVRWRHARNGGEGATPPSRLEEVAAAPIIRPSLGACHATASRFHRRAPPGTAAVRRTACRPAAWRREGRRRRSRCRC